MVSTAWTLHGIPDVGRCMGAPLHAMASTRSNSLMDMEQRKYSHMSGLQTNSQLTVAQLGVGKAQRLTDSAKRCGCTLVAQGVLGPGNEVSLGCIADFSAA